MSDDVRRWQMIVDDVRRRQMMADDNDDYR
jgi:hypothetical protein